MIWGVVDRRGEVVKKDGVESRQMRRKGTKLTEFLVRTKSSTLICRLPESFGFSSTFLGRAMMNVLDDYCSVNKRKCRWRVSAEMMFSRRDFGG